MQTRVDVALPIQVAGLALLIMFAGTFGGRWAMLAGAVVLLFVGFALSGVRVTIRLGTPAPADEVGESR